MVTFFRMVGHILVYRMAHCKVLCSCNADTARYIYPHKACSDPHRFCCKCDVRSNSHIYWNKVGKHQSNHPCNYDHKREGDHISIGMVYGGDLDDIDGSFLLIIKKDSHC